MRVKEVMSKEIFTVKRSTKLKELLKIFAKFHIFPLVPVVEDGNRLVGIVSFRNLINAFLPYKPEILKNVPFLDEDKEDDIFQIELSPQIGDLVVVEDIMETKFISLNEHDTLEKAFKLMKLHLKDEVPVVDETGKLVGILGIFDIIRELFREKGVI